MDKITLDREVFKALASDTRLDILKALDVRQKTVTELAKELDLNKATVFEHLEKLAAVDLIQKLEDDRKWVYWQLTWKGRRLLHPEKITLALLLSSAMGTLLTAFAATWLWWKSNIAAPLDTVLGDERAEKGFEDNNFRSEAQADSAESPPASPSSSGANGSAEGEPASAFLVTPDPTPAPAAAADVVHDPVYLAIAVVLGVVFLALVGYAAYYWRRRRQEESGAEAGEASA